MHGAGHTHICFLQPHAGLIELFPVYFAYGDACSFIAGQWKMHYIRWKNTDQSREFPNLYTALPPDEIVKFVLDMRGRMCLS